MSPPEGGDIIYVKVQSHCGVCIAYADFRKRMQILEKKRLIRTTFNPASRQQAFDNVWVAYS